MLHGDSSLSVYSKIRVEIKVMLCYVYVIEAHLIHERVSFSGPVCELVLQISD